MNEQLMSVAMPFRKRQPVLSVPRGNLFRRMLTVKAVAMIRKSRVAEEDIAAELWPSDVELGLAIKAASAPAMTTVPGWAKELAQTILLDTIEALGATSAGAEMLADALVLSWSGAGSIGVPGFVASAANAKFVAEGDLIPVGQLATTAPAMQPHKLGSIAVLTREMMEGSNAEAMIGDTLVKSAALALDAALFGSAAASAAQPAGLRNGIAALAPSASADPFGAFFEDISSLIGAVGQVGGKGPFYLIGSAGRIVSARQRFVTEAGDIIPVISAAVGNDLIAVASQAIVAALSPTADMETATTGTLVMDTAPVAGGGPERSLFQTDSVAIKMRWPVSWVLRDARGVAWLTPAWK